MDNGIVASCVNPVESQVLRGKKNPILFSVFAVSNCREVQSSVCNDIMHIIPLVRTAG
jgi:hypothetical protein